MQLILDNIAAIMITSTVLLILMAVMHENQQAQVEAASYYALKTKALGFMDILERDLQNADSVLTTRMDLSGSNNTFAFYSQFDSTMTDAFCVRYEFTQAGTRDTKEGAIQLYQVQRYQGPPPPADCLTDPGMEPAGASPATVTEWTIIPLNESDQPVNDPALLGDARAVRAHFAIWSPFEVDAESYVKETTWTLTFRPPLMRTSGAIYL